MAETLRIGPRWLGFRVAVALGPVLCLTACSGATGGTLPFASREPLWEAVLRDLDRYYFDPAVGGRELSPQPVEVGSPSPASRGLGASLEEMDETLSTLEDSHTFIIPPTWTSYGDFGFSAGFIGDTAFVTKVIPGGAADLAGLRAGDEILALGVGPPGRKSLQRVLYRMTLVNPKQSIPLVIRRGDGDPEPVSVVPELVGFPPFYVVWEGFEEWFAPWGPQIERVWAFSELSPEISYWRFDLFDVEDRGRIRAVFEALEGTRTLVLDLRENVGGAVDVLREVVAHFFREPVLAGAFIRRDGISEFWVEPETNRSFGGELVVLTGSSTGSAAEILAALVQERGRGDLVGDRTAGAVMLSQRRRFEVPHPEGHWSSEHPYRLETTGPPGESGWKALGSTRTNCFSPQGKR